MGTKLNFGCGKDIRVGYINVDIDDKHNPDVVHDLNVFPWPWEDNSIEQIMALDILEHVEDLIPIMDEAQRVMQPAGVMYIRGPSPDFIWDDVTHKRAFKLMSFDHFDRSTHFGQKYQYGEDPGWRVASKSQNQSIIMFTLIAHPENDGVLPIPTEENANEEKEYGWDADTNQSD